MITTIFPKRLRSSMTAARRITAGSTSSRGIRGASFSDVMKTTHVNTTKLKIFPISDMVNFWYPLFKNKGTARWGV